MKRFNFSDYIVAPTPRVPFGVRRTQEVKSRVDFLREQMAPETELEVFADGRSELWPAGLKLTPPLFSPGPASTGTPASDLTDEEFLRGFECALERADEHDKWCARVYKLDERRSDINREIQHLCECIDTYYIRDDEHISELQTELEAIEEELWPLDTFGWPIPSFNEL